MSLSFLALATRTSWPHSSKSRLTQGEWVPVSMAMRIGGCSEAKRLLKASGVVRSLPSSTTSPLPVPHRHRERRGGGGGQVGVFVAEIQSGCHQWLHFATIHCGPILLPYWAF